jgi:hypothetical protein
VLTLR